MCGIVGWIDWEKDLSQEKNILKKMTDTLIPRGPDADGYWLSHKVAIGHRRLSVVDLEGGVQPMVRQKGENQYILTYNGELYNTPELRRELESRGYKFSTSSDTEVLLISFIEWGPNCLDYFNGIFAFGIWDSQEESLFLARDRLGVKPLFYHLGEGRLLFGSEIKALLAHPELKAEIDTQGLAEIFALGPARTPGNGVFKGVSELKPGFCLSYNRQGIKIRQYWQLESKPHEDDLATTVNKVQELLADSARRQLVSDVPIGTFLSGGLDSSILTAFAANVVNSQNQGPLHTYSVDYVDNDLYFKPSHFQPNSDNHWIKIMSEHFSTYHHRIEIDIPQLVESLHQAVKARDLPGMADIDSSLFLFCQEIKKGATVMLSGECADEIFGGYPWFHSEKALSYHSFPWSRAIEERSFLLSPQLAAEIDLQQYITQRYEETLSQMPKLPGEEPLAARRREMFYLNQIWFMTTLLDRKDRMSMASGLEVRVPFCDHRLVEYLWNIPWEMKSLGQQEKGLLREAMKGILPEEVRIRKKSPYPKTHNPNYLAAVCKKLEEILADPSSPILPLINVTGIKEMLASDENDLNKPFFGQLMTRPQLYAYLIQIDLWLREYSITIS